MIQSEEYIRTVRLCAAEMTRELRLREGTILIAGAAGLVGCCLTDCLMAMNEGYGTHFRVIALGRQAMDEQNPLKAYKEKAGFSYVVCDINKELPEMGAVDYIVHAASNTHPIAYSKDPIGTIMTNVIGTQQLLEYGRRHEVSRFLFLSSVEIYGEGIEKSSGCAEEDCGYIDCNTVRAGYPESKRVGECLCRAYESRYGVESVTLRLCRVYGPTMKTDDSKALSQFIRKAAQGEDIVLKSKGEQYYSYLYVLDAVRAILYLLEKGNGGEVYNVSSRESDIRLAALADKLAALAGTKVVFEVPDAAEQRGYSKATTAILDSGKLQRLGWKAIYDLEYGLRVTVDALKERRQ